MGDEEKEEQCHGGGGGRLLTSNRCSPVKIDVKAVSTFAMCQIDERIDE